MSPPQCEVRDVVVRAASTLEMDSVSEMVTARELMEKQEVDEDVSRVFEHFFGCVCGILGGKFVQVFLFLLGR